jgi:hypothetical protein
MTLIEDLNAAVTTLQVDAANAASLQATKATADANVTTALADQSAAAAALTGLPAQLGADQAAVTAAAQALVNSILSPPSATPGQ